MPNSHKIIFLWFNWNDMNQSLDIFKDFDNCVSQESHQTKYNQVTTQPQDSIQWGILVKNPNTESKGILSTSNSLISSTFQSKFPVNQYSITSNHNYPERSFFSTSTSLKMFCQLWRNSGESILVFLQTFKMRRDQHPALSLCVHFWLFQY